MLVKSLIWCFAALMLVTAALPLFGLNFILPRAELGHIADLDGHYYLFVLRSAALLTTVFFAINFLRHKRPLSSASPLLVFSNALILSGISFLFAYQDFSPARWFAVLALLPVSIFFGVQNESESKRIFVDSW
jgi:peptidoglycan/LPS O-acetylase OafA/YrhL